MKREGATNSKEEGNKSIRLSLMDQSAESTVPTQSHILVKPKRMKTIVSHAWKWNQKKGR